MCLDYASRKAHFYSGARKILQGTSYSFPNLDGDLNLADIGYTKSKMTMLKRFYYNEESVNVAKRLWDQRLEKGRYGSVGMTTFNHFVKSEKTSPRGSVMGPCLLAVTLTLTPDGTAVDVFYRTTEVFKKWPADLVFIKEQLLIDFPLPNLYNVKFHFANLTTHPMYAITIIPHIEDPIKELEKIRAKDPYFFKWLTRWTSRYVLEEHGHGIQKFSQALRVQKSAYDLLDKDKLKLLQDYCQKNHPGYDRSVTIEGADDEV